MGGGMGDVTPLRWTRHALDGMVARGIERVEVERTLEAPERVVPDPPRREVLMRRYHDTRLGKEMLLRVVVEDDRDERVVVTVYATSRIAKYLGGEGS